MSSEIDIADWIQSSSAIKSHSSKKKKSGSGARTNDIQFAVSTAVHYQSGENVVIVLGHHPHHLRLEEEEGRGQQQKKTHTMKKVTVSCQSHLQSLWKSEQTTHNV